MAIRTETLRRPLFALLLGICLTVQGAEPPVETIVVPAGKSLREIAKEQLGDPELWQEILETNDLQSVVQVQPGMKLKIPARMVVETNRQLAGLQEEIRQATRLSARVFAPLEMERAVGLRDQALSKRQERNWESALALASEARRQAQRAIAICREKADLRAEAVLTDAKGSVETRPADKPVWKGVEVKAALAEGERLRTLANSSAEVQFRDESRLRLDENSQVLIQKMRSNLLEQKEQASVSILQGDVYALLGGNPQRGAFDLQIPGVELKGNSNNFYVNKGDSGARFANYEGKLEVASDNGSVALKENEGVALRANGFSNVKQLLPAPHPLLPADHDLHFTKEMRLTWEPVEGAASYWVEVSRERTFAGEIPIVERVRATELMLHDLAEGAWYWRLAAVDKEEFPGPRSDAREFILARDTIPPYLQIREPAEGALLHRPQATLQGVAEIGSQVTIAGTPVEVTERGELQGEVTLNEGANPITVVAEDSAGNRTELVRTLYYAPPAPVTLTLDGSAEPSDGLWRFFSRGPEFTLTGRTLPHAHLEVRDQSGGWLAKGEASAEGGFVLLWPLAAERGEFRLAILSTAGERREERIEVQLDQEPPACLFDPLPARTAATEATLSGRCSGAAQLTLLASPAPLPASLEDNGGGEAAFRLDRPLREGENLFLWEARDAAGNTAHYEQRVQCDPTPPRIGKSQLTVKKEGERSWVEILVEATDQSPLARAAPFSLKAGSFEYRGQLLLDPRGGGYRGRVALPLGSKETPRIAELRIRDQLGNETETTPK